MALAWGCCVRSWTGGVHARVSLPATAAGRVPPQDALTLVIGQITHGGLPPPPYPMAQCHWFSVLCTSRSPSGPETNLEGQVLRLGPS
jgi:hypothetical protein